MNTINLFQPDTDSWKYYYSEWRNIDNVFDCTEYILLVNYGGILTKSHNLKLIIFHPRPCKSPISQDRKGQLMTNQQHHSNEWIFNITIN